jgi:hypothetical protein
VQFPRINMCYQGNAPCFQAMNKRIGIQLSMSADLNYIIGVLFVAKKEQ